MCLELKPNSHRMTAKRDIIVYKQLEKGRIVALNEKLKNGTEVIVKLSTYDDPIKAVISNSGWKTYLCSDDHRLNGAIAPDKQNKKYSWILDDVVISIKTAEKEYLKTDSYSTRFQDFPVMIGETYTSELIRSLDNTVSIGLHSFVDFDLAAENNDYIIAECIIPKGSKYYIGDFEGVKDSIASDTLKYVKIVRK